MPIITPKQIKEADDDAQRARNQFLRGQGWSYSSDWPGSIWLWSKEMKDGKTFVCGESTAMQIAESQWWSDHPDEEDEPE